MNFQEGAFIYVNKPYRMSSFGALAHIRYLVSRRLKVRRLKMGHAGTLDPLATGVLILCTGKATKQIESLQLQSKEYTATLQLGATTASYDREHTVDYTYPTRHITRELILATLPRFVGEVMQVPPVYSACMVDGHRAYKHRRDRTDRLRPSDDADEHPGGLWQGYLYPFAGPRYRLCPGQWCLPDGALSDAGG